MDRKRVIYYQHGEALTWAEPSFWVMADSILKEPGR